jgi:hypothetical protein
VRGGGLLPYGADTASGCLPTAVERRPDQYVLTGFALVRRIKMVQSLRPSRLAGRTFRFTWTAGPKNAVTHEYVFHTDGTVSYAPIEPDRPPQYTTAKQYGAFEVAEDIYLVSYLESGYALSVALNFKEKRLQGFATSATQWYPVQGRFEELSK